MPSPSPENPGLFIRDPYRFSDAMLIIPPVLVGCLECFDGTHTDLDLRAALVRLTGDLSVGEIAENLTSTLSAAGFLEDDVFLRMRQDPIAFSPWRRRTSAPKEAGNPTRPPIAC